jgi:hypothetical protein
MRSIRVFALVVVTSASALAAPTGRGAMAAKKSKPSKPAWSFSIVQASPASLFVPVTARAPAVPRRAAPTHERTLVRELHPGDPPRSVRLVLDADAEGNVRQAAVEVTTPATTGAKRVVALGPLAVGESIALASFELVDIDFDGYLDLRVARERGAKWVMHNTLVYDAKSDNFVVSELARQLSQLSNVTVDPKTKHLTREDIGPSEPKYVSYQVVGGKLRLLRECTVTMLLGAVSGGTLRARVRNGDGFREIRYERAPEQGGLADACERAQ